MKAAALLLVVAALVPARASAQRAELRAPRPAPPTATHQGSQMDSLLAAAQRAAQAWRGHDFAALFAAGGDVRLQLPGAEPTGALRAGQAAELLRAFVQEAQEQSVEIQVVRRVDDERAYVEVRRDFTVRGTSARRSETVYFGLRLDRDGYRVVDVRVVR